MIAKYKKDTNWQKYFKDPNINIITNGELRIKDGTTTIANNAFKNNPYITKLYIPSSVTYIGDRAFYGCSGLNEIIFEDADKSDGLELIIKNGAF
jgi:hypothetical protein